MGSKPPLGLPEGSVRAILALMIAATVCVLSLWGKIVPDYLVRLVEVAFVGYGLVRATQWQSPAPPMPPADPADPPAPAPDG